MTRHIANKLLPWRRFWVPWDGAINSGYDGRGFLDDPEDELGEVMNPRVMPLERLLGQSCLILSGQPGIGKTTEIERLISGQTEWLNPKETLIHFHCRHIDSVEALLRDTVESPRWRAVLDVGGHVRLLMDGVDEALNRVAVLVPALIQRLRGEPLDRVRVIMVCRVADWDPAAGNELSSLWPESIEHTVYELCHLRRRDAELAAQESGLDSEAFLESVYRLHIEGLAARPITLRMLLDETRHGGQLPGDHRTLFGRAIRRLSREWDSNRLRYLPAPPPPDLHIEKTAARIASLLLLSGRNTILRGDDPPSPGELPFDEIVGGTESVNGCTFEVTRPLVRAALDTPLFTSRGNDRFGFDHATYSEHLCASYLSGCALSQIRKLLCVRAAGFEHVAPQLAEVAANLANIHPGWCDHLIENEPEVLVRSDASGLGPDQKARLVASLLSRAAVFKAFDDRDASRFYHSLSHTSLPGQLRDYINDPSHNFLVRRMAIDIAGEAGVGELEPDLWARAEANDERLGPIAYALGKLTGPPSRERLLQAARGELPDNEAGDLKGMAICKLVPSIMPVREVLPHLRAKPSRNWIGAYNLALLSHIPRAMTIEDLPALANFIVSTTDSFDHRTHLDPLVAQAFKIGLRHVEDAAIGQSLALLWQKLARNHRPFPRKSSRSDAEPLAALSEPSIRRRFATYVLNNPHTKPHHLLDPEYPLLCDEDLVWLLDELPGISSAIRQVWAKTCGQLCWRPVRSANRELILRRHGEIPELRDFLPTPGKHDVVITMDRLQRATEIRFARRRSSFARQTARPTRNELLDGVRVALAEGENTAWVDFCNCAYETAPQDPDNADGARTDRSDIESSPGWRSLTVEEHQSFRASARRFLLAHHDRDRAVDSWSNYSQAAWYAIRLLREDMDADHKLRAAVFERWPMVVFDHLGTGGAVERDQVSRACRWVPGLARAWISRDLARSHARGDAGIHLSLFSDCWNEHLSAAMVAFLKAHTVRAGLFVNAVGFLCQRDRAAARHLIDHLLSTRENRFDDLDELSRGLATIALFRFPKEFLPDLWRLLEQSPVEEVRSVFLAGIEWLRWWGGMNFDEMTEADLGRLILLCCRLFPRSAYSDRHDASGFVQTRHEVPEFRNGLIAALVTRGTPQACDQFRWLSENAPKSDRWLFLWRLHDCTENLLRRTWTSVQRSTSEILTLARDRRVAIVEDEEDLTWAVLASLERLQERLKCAEAPELHALWNQPSNRRGRPTHKTETILSNTVKDWLSRDLGPNTGIILNREVSATLAGRLDIKMEAARRGKPTITLVIEVKGSWNLDVKRAVAKQLVARYLKLNQWTHGIMLVGWFGPETGKRRLRDWPSTDLAAATEAVARWCREQTPTGFLVCPIVLDCDICMRLLPGGRLHSTGGAVSVTGRKRFPKKRRRPPTASSRARSPKRTISPRLKVRKTSPASRGSGPNPGPKGRKKRRSKSSQP